MSKYVWDNLEREISEERQKKVTEKLREEQKIKLEQDEEIERKRVKFRRIMFGTIAIILFVACLFIPFIVVEDVKINPLTIIDIQQSELKKEYTPRISLFNKVTLNYRIAKSSDFIESVKSSYDSKTKVLEIKITEAKPLAITDNGELYFWKNLNLYKTDKSQISAPLMTNMSEEVKTALLNQLKTLQYDIIKEIEVISPSKDYTENHVVILKMRDGNIVEIVLEDISTKLSKYLEIKKIINAKNGGKPGIIHLDMGDYYEPKK
ncbi:MAG: hypothetical protein ACRCUP_01535 [Mycoplasmatales bacterium]